MNKLVKKYTALILCAVMLVLPMNVWAAPSFGISANASSVKPGASFSVSVGGSCCGRVDISVQNGSASASSVWVEEGYEGVTITAGDSGSVVVTATPQAGFSDLDGNSYEPGARSVTVSIEQPQSSSPSQSPSTPNAPAKDSNSKLSDLQVSPGSLAPAFSANTTSYTVTVPEDTASVTISATPQSAKAKVSVSGGKDLKLGPNEASVVVTAENGSTTTYALTIMCGELEKITIGTQIYHINESFADEQIPAGFIREKVTYNERQYEALSHEKSGMKLMSLVNEEVGAAYYIYNPDTQSFYNFIQIQLSEGKVVIPLPTDESEEFTANEKTEVTLQDKVFEAWKIDEEFCVFKMLNVDGQEVFYQYDAVDGTFQRYMGPVVEEPVVEEDPEEKTFLETYYLYIIIGLAVLTVILAITTIYLASTSKHKHSARKRKMQKKLEKEQEKALDDEFEK